jgi:hypothetical protein
MNGPTTFAISMVADAQPDVLLRIAAQLNFLNVPPQRFSLSLQADDTVVIEIVTKDTSDYLVDLIVRKLAQLTCAREVGLR